MPPRKQSLGSDRPDQPAAGAETLRAVDLADLIEAGRGDVLPVPLTNRAQYGRPDVVPVLWAVDEYEPYAILAVDREHARILIAYLGRTTTVDEETLELDTSDWRFKAGRQPSFTGRGGGGGSGRAHGARPAH